MQELIARIGRRISEAEAVSPMGMRGAAVSYMTDQQALNEALASEIKRCRERIDQLEWHARNADPQTVHDPQTVADLIARVENLERQDRLRGADPND